MGTTRLQVGARHRILVLGEDDERRQRLAHVIHQAGFEVAALTVAAAEPELVARDVALVVLAGDDLEPGAFERLRELARPAALALVGGAQAGDFVFTLAWPVTAEDLLAAISEAVQGAPLLSAQNAAIRAYFDALSMRDWDGLVALCSEDVVYELPGNDELARRLTGRAALRRHTEEAFERFPGSSFDIEGVLSTPSMAIARYRATWWTPEGVARITGAVCFQFAGAQIAHIGVRLDMDQARKAPARG